MEVFKFLQSIKNTKIKINSKQVRIKKRSAIKNILSISKYIRTKYHKNNHAILTLL